MTDANAIGKYDHNDTSDVSGRITTVDGMVENQIILNTAGMIQIIHKKLKQIQPPSTPKPI